MDVDIHLRQGGANHVGVRFLQQFQGMQHHVARRVAPANAEQGRIGQTSDDARIRHRLCRRCIEQHQIVVLPQRLQQAPHRCRHQQAECVGFAAPARNGVHAAGGIGLDDIGQRSPLLQAVHQTRRRFGLRRSHEARLVDVAIQHDDPLAVHRRKPPQRAGDGGLAFPGSRGRDRDHARPIGPQVTDRHAAREAARPLAKAACAPHSPRC